MRVPIPEPMPGIRVECLACGLPRRLAEWRLRRSAAGPCPRCGYVGWAPSRDLTEDDRRGLRELPVWRRGRRAAA